MTFTYTTSGKLTFEDISTDDINIDDIATSLSRQVRFNGHGKFPWSVAQHSLLVANITEMLLFEEKGTSWWIKKILLGLLHDAHEAYIGDIVRPVKSMLPLICGMTPVDKLEAFLQDPIQEKVNPALVRTRSHEVFMADNIALCLELTVLFPHVDVISDHPSMPLVKKAFESALTPFDPERDKAAWLARLNDLTAALG